MSAISIAIISIIALLPVSIFVMCFVIALGKRQGNRRRNPSNLMYEGKERRCKFRDACPVGRICIDPTDCTFGQEQDRYLKLLDLRSKNTETHASVQ